MLVLPWSCVQPDNHRLMPRFRGKGLMAAPAYRDAKARARVTLAQQWKQGPLAGDVQLVARVYFPDKRKRDAGNYRKLIGDALTGIAYGDDAQLVDERWIRAGVDKTHPRVELTLCRVEAA